jgi:hypothetical protein
MNKTKYTDRKNLTTPDLFHGTTTATDTEHEPINEIENNKVLNRKISDSNKSDKVSLSNSFKFDDNK